MTLDLRPDGLRAETFAGGPVEPEAEADEEVTESEDD